MMPKIYLVHWNEAEAEERASSLRDLGYEVAHELSGPAIFRDIRKNPPDVLIIDLSRLPSHGRDIALNLRQAKTTRMIPIIFIEGEPEKTIHIKEHLPDAIYSTWGKIRGSIKYTLAHPLKDPIVPNSVFDGYSNTPLPKKLGIKANMAIALINCPDGFKKLLGELPRGTILVEKTGKSHDLMVWFLLSEKELRGGIKKMKAGLAEKGCLWIAWPKKTSGIQSDLSQVVVRKIGLDAGLVDFKVCSIDDTWSGLKFVKRKLK
jgi:CheY-like chemotaxis protein